MTTRPQRLAILAFGALALAACGRQGELEKPGPLFGKAPAVAPDAVTRDAAMARARSDGAARADPRAPASVDEVREQGVATLRAQTGASATSDSLPASSAPQ